MNIIIERKFHILKETVDLAMVSVNDIRLKSSYQECNSTYYNIAKSIYEKCKNQMILDENEKQFFTIFPAYSCCLAQLLLYSFVPLCDLNHFECFEQLITGFQAFTLEKFPCFVPTSYGLSLEENTEQSFVKTVQSLELNESEKLAIIFAFYNYEENIRKLLKILSRINHVIQDGLSSLNNPNQLLLEDMNDEIVFEYFKKSDHGILNEIKDTDMTMYLYPSLICFESFSLYLDNFENPYLFFGIGRKAEYLYLQLPEQKERNIHAFLNAISDPTKMEILKIIKTEPKYGQELAEILNLKKPTISYHMDTLVQLGLVKIERVQKRLYYSINKNEVEKMIEMVKEYLL